MWYYAPETWCRNTFLGYPIKQCPFDLQIYQELIFRSHFASMLDLVGADAETSVIAVDIYLTDEAKSLRHPELI
jgi:hypothetical protein